MKEFILELYSEEMPARFQQDAGKGFYKIFEQFFQENAIEFCDLKTFVAPTRIVITANVAEASPEKIIDIKGPKRGAAQAALDGFCRANNVSLSDLTLRNIDANQFYFLEKKQEKIGFIDLLSKDFTNLLLSYTWPKSMVWAEEDMRWCRPLRNIFCIYDNNIIDLRFFSLSSSNFTYGHKFQNFHKLYPKSLKEYFNLLRENKIIVAAEERKSIIENSIASICGNTMSLNRDDALIEEICGLAEYPTILKGEIDAKFMNLPEEVLITSMKNHQKYLTISDKEGRLLPYFLFATNLVLDDYSGIIAGNQKVLNARLSDALYFYNHDKTSNLEEAFDKLKNVVFHTKLGTMHDKVLRLLALAEKICPEIIEAAKFCKIDLVLEMVGEFPELQGIMGYYYAKNKGLSAYTSLAIRDHYKPMGMDDTTPGDGAAILSLIDKLDSLVALYLAGERATGSKDPYALRRYSIGIIRTILDNNLDYNFDELINLAISNLKIPYEQEDVKGVTLFIEERLKHFLKAKIPPEILNITVNFAKTSNILHIMSSSTALNAVLASDSGQNILALYKRAKNISSDYGDRIEIEDCISSLNESESALYYTIKIVGCEVTNLMKNNNFEQSLNQLLALEAPMSLFFQENLVNSSNSKETRIRKNILLKATEVFEHVADFSIL